MGIILANGLQNYYYNYISTNNLIHSRLILVNSHKDANKRRHSRLRQRPNSKMNHQLKNFGKSKSLDSSDIFNSSSNNSPNFVLKEKKIPEQIEPIEVRANKDKDKLQKNEERVTININNNSSNMNNNSPKNNNNNNNKKTARDFFSSPLMRRKKDHSNKGRGKYLCIFFIIVCVYLLKFSW